MILVYGYKNFVVLFKGGKIVDYYVRNYFTEIIRPCYQPTIAIYKKVKKYHAINSTLELTKEDIEKLHKYYNEDLEYYNQFRTKKI